MSKGHLEALAALKAMGANGVTKPATNFVTVTKTELAEKYPNAMKIGRPKVHASAADKQMAYRNRKAKIAQEVKD